jgi:hypothetical protein
VLNDIPIVREAAILTELDASRAAMVASPSFREHPAFRIPLSLSVLRKLADRVSAQMLQYGHPGTRSHVRAVHVSVRRLLGLLAPGVVDSHRVEETFAAIRRRFEGTGTTAEALQRITLVPGYQVCARILFQACHETFGFVRRELAVSHA